MEVSHVRRRLQASIAAARERAQQRRQRSADAERAYAVFLQEVATPVTRQVANALKAEGYCVHGVHARRRPAPRVGPRPRRLHRVRARHRSDPPQVIGRISHTRGSRTIDEERPVKTGAAPRP